MCEINIWFLQVKIEFLFRGEMSFFYFLFCACVGIEGKRERAKRKGPKGK